MTPLPVPHATTGAGIPARSMTSFFHNAHNMVLNHPTMISQVIHNGDFAIHYLLAQKSCRGGMLHSSSRFYAPRCHPETRESLRGDIIQRWETAIAQTVAEDLEKLGLLGAVYFCSRTGGLDDANLIVPTIAYQLSVKLPEYKAIVTKCLYDDPLILEKDIRSQFRALLAEPFRDFTIENPSQDPLLTVVDGLDECHDKDVQLELIEAINSLSRKEGIRFLWLICSRPECHLKNKFANADFPILCRRLEVPIDDLEAQNDVLRILRTEFGQIHCKYSDQLSTDWPPETHLLRIATAASGHLGFASFIMKFIGDQEYGDPAGQLDVCMRFLGGPDSSTTVNPLHALDLLFRQILSDIPAKVLGTTLRILGFIAVFPIQRPCAQVLANFLSIDRGLFYQSLRLLHSLLNIPSSSEADRLPLRIAHASFSDFLLDPHRSRGFAINRQVVLCNTAIWGLDWQSATRSLHDVKWINVDQDPDIIFGNLRKISQDVTWGACSRTLDDGNIDSLLAKLEQFDFSGIKTVPDEFPQFLFWLSSLGDRSLSLVCFVDKSEIDGTQPQEFNLLMSSAGPVTKTVKRKKYFGCFSFRRET